MWLTLGMFSFMNVSDHLVVWLCNVELESQILATDKLLTVQAALHLAVPDLR